MGNRAVNIAEKYAEFSELWAPKIVASVNDYAVKIAKIKGEFVWHTHPETDELFHVVSGLLVVQLRDGDVEVGPGEMFVVPRGVEHCPRADEETAIMLIEPTATVNTGDVGGPRTRAPEPLD